MKTLDIARPLLGAAFLSLSLVPAALGQDMKAPVSPTGAAEATVPAEARRIEISDVQARMGSGQKVLFVDGRGHVSGKIVKDAVHVPYDTVETWAKDVPKNTLIVAYCACSSEQTSLAIVRKLQDLGFTNSFALHGGIQGWILANLPTTEAPMEWK